MSRYTTVESIIWHDEKFRGLPEDSRTLFLYLLTSPHSNMLGLFYLPKLYACSDLQWEPERYQRGIDILLCDTLLIEVDKDVIWVKNYLKHNPIRGEKQVSGVVNRLRTLPRTNLTNCSSETCVNTFRELISASLRNPIHTLSIPYVIPLRLQEQQQEQQQKQARKAPEKQDDDDDDNQNLNTEIIKSFSQTFGYPPNQTQLEMLTSFIDDGLQEELVLEALKRLAEAGANSPTYTRAILQSGISKAAYTLEDVHALDNFRRPNRQKRQEGETAAERLLREAIEQEESEKHIINVSSWTKEGSS